MLLIGDIHIHPRYCDTTIDMLRQYISEHSDEKNIIFVWDYVYHFSYHRISLLALLDFFLELVQHGKEVYIVAWNHDWLGQHFVYTEAEKILHHNHTISEHHIHFITQPCVKTIDNQTIIFLPYTINRSHYKPQSESYFFENWTLEQHTTNNNIKSSYLLNACLDDMIKKERLSDQKKELIVIHHYYTADTKFPGIKALFGYKDIALSPQWLDDSQLRLISGHIHHSFSYKNYLCIGAVWSTSPLEHNLYQYLFQYQDWKIQAQQIALNPYLTITLHDGEIIEDDTIEHHREKLKIMSQQQFSSPAYTIEYKNIPLPKERAILTITSNTIGYDNLSNTIHKDLQQSFRDIKIKQDLWTLDVMIENLVDANKDFSSGWSDRKILLDEYLEKKFGERKQLYIDTLKELKIHN